MNNNPARQWFALSSNMDTLRELMRDKVFRAACDTLLYEAQPSLTVVASSDILANKLCYLSGYNQFLRDLYKLCELPAVPTNFIGEEWAYAAEDKT